ncbi:hypothetical protein SELMODRAFT_430939 [Selaginella moellendorffii]|uniref:Uncharacterized protein n=1 Tax=Selaginella moellendorffii TaxID=88036 RepID=D8TB08_SELML|nr:hypothetical protein SELMODRAFT_430939 [Selaginella moellendorffii]
MEAGCGSVKAEASVSIAAGCDPMKVDGLVKMEAGFESARVEAPVGSVKMEPGYDTVKVETPFGGGKAAHLCEAKVVPIENDTAKAAEKQPVVLDAQRWWLLQETEVAGRGDTEDFADLGKLARRFLDKNSSQVPSTAYVKEVVDDIRKGESAECPICLEMPEDAVLTSNPADNVVHPAHSSGELKARPGLHFESPVFRPSAAETSDFKRAPEQPRRSVTPAKDDKQQFHGNGSELLQLLQGGPGRVKPTASTKVDATQDSGDSGEPSKKGSPSAVHGPIGPPRRHVVSPPQSPNDLLGRLWAALPSSSHTLFGGESERKTSARSFSVEANEMSREVDGAKGIGACRLALPLNGYDYNDSKTNDKPRTNSASGRLQDYRGRSVNGEAEFEPGGDDFRGAGRRRGTGRPDARRGGRGAVGQWIAVNERHKDAEPSDITSCDISDGRDESLKS